MSTPGTIWGVGLGPGDPELMSVKADRLVRRARHVAFFRKKGRPGHARTLVDGMLAPETVEHAMEYPVTTEIPLTDPRYNACLSEFYVECRQNLLSLAGRGEDVVVLCEGDPFFYGSFMHLYTRLKDEADVRVVPATTGMSAAWTATGQPVTWGDDVFTVLMGTLAAEDLTKHMAGADALVVMKIGRHLGKVRDALKTAGRLEDAWLVECASMPGQSVARLADVEATTVPYFTIIVVHGNGRRP
ncbi:MAG: precorrin-2 C(20)-methyltransferase [Pseudomonadota bacterium]